MAVNNPKWSNGSIVLLQSTDVAWLDGSVLFDFEYVTAGGTVNFVSSISAALSSGNLDLLIQRQLVSAINNVFSIMSSQLFLFFIFAFKQR